MLSFATFYISMALHFSVFGRISLREFHPYVCCHDAGPGDVALGKGLSGQTKPVNEESEDEAKKENYCWWVPCTTHPSVFSFTIVFLSCLFLAHIFSSSRSFNLYVASPPHPTGVKGMTSLLYMGADCQMGQLRVLPHPLQSSSLLSEWARTAWCIGVCVCQCVWEYSSISMHFGIKHRLFFPISLE